jgi:hypothetical protein
MPDRRYLVLLAGLAAAVLPPFACSPQVVDAVDTLPTGGSAGSGASGSGGSGVTGGSAGSGLTGGEGPACPDGGSEANRDGDEWIDCLDDCPDDPLKQRPVTCGCGLPDSVEDGGTTCQELQPLLEHRYTFAGTGTVVVDSKGGADGVVLNTVLTGQSTVTLEGGTSDQYVDLPNRILSVFPSVTVEAWLEWSGGGGPWQRIFDFGEPVEGIEDVQSSGGSYLFLTTRTADTDPGDPTYRGPYLRAVYGRPLGLNVVESRASAELNSPRIFPSGRLAHVAVAVDGEVGSMFVYIDGVLEGSFVPEPVPDAVPPPVDLSLVNDINCWLGKSQFSYDQELAATFHEFRIYNAALTAEQIALSKIAGPDAVFFP